MDDLDKAILRLLQEDDASATSSWPRRINPVATGHLCPGQGAEESGVIRQ